MKFIDEATIELIAGHGGPGCVSFRREKYVPRGGPDGGDGGKGGDIIFRSDSRLGTLQDFRYKRTFKAESGLNGLGANKAGKSGKDEIILVPVGTVIKNAETGEQLIDFKEAGVEWHACKGGRGGKGNAHFVTSTFQAPKFAQPGEEGERMTIQMELKLIADVGIIGMPNAGKSTLISHISAAKPKIADYAFTTLTPNLGVVTVGDSDPFVVADIPGLIEGAHRGAGLGHKFLRHIERTRIFVHVLDGTRLLEASTEPFYEGMPVPEEEEKADYELLRNYKAIRKELGLFDENLLHKPEITVLNKADLFKSDPEMLKTAREKLRQSIQEIRGVPPMKGEPFVISAVSGEGVQALLSALRLEMDRIQEELNRKKSNKSEVPLPFELTSKEDGDE